MMKKTMTAILCSILLIALTASACGNDGNAAASQSAGSAGVYDAVMEDAGESYDQAMDDGVGYSEDMAEMKSAAAAEEEGAGTLGTEGVSAAGAGQNQKQKLIYTYNYSVETKEFDSFYEKVNQKVIQTGGYIEHSETNGSAADGINRSANLTLRIPAEQMDQILTLLDSDANVTYQSRSSENVTLQYVDMESHLKALRTEQEALLQLMEKADKLKDVIALQSQLTQVRYEIESYESQLRTYDNLVDYSTLYLDIIEVERTTTVPSSKISFFDEIGNRFSDNVYALGQWLRALAVWLIGSLPILVPVAAVGIAAGIFIYRKVRGGKRNRHSQVTHEDSQE